MLEKAQIWSQRFLLFKRLSSFTSGVPTDQQQNSNTLGTSISSQPKANRPSPDWEMLSVRAHPQCGKAGAEPRQQQPLPRSPQYLVQQKGPLAGQAPGVIHNSRDVPVWDRQSAGRKRPAVPSPCGSWRHQCVFLPTLQTGSYRISEMWKYHPLYLQY